MEKKALAADEKKEMGTGKRTGKGAARLMVLLLLSSLGSGPLAGALASESTPAAVSDARLFTREFREKGALRFYEATEEELRLGRFEAAFLRYRFLKAQVGGDPAYRPLTAMVEHRLCFLAGQMGLTGQEVPPLRATRSRPSPAAPAGPRAVKDPAPAKGAEPGKAEAVTAAQTESSASPPPAPDMRPSAETSPAGPPGPDAAPPAAPEQQKPLSAEPADQKSAPEAPAPSPSRWQRLKARLFFWRK